MQLLVKGTRRIIFILCAVSDAKRYYSSPLKLAPLQTSLRHVRRSAHNADSRIPRITRTLKCAPTHLLFLHWVLAICYIIVVTALFSVFSLSSGIDATAVVLTVEVVFVG